MNDRRHQISVCVKLLLTDSEKTSLLIERTSIKISQHHMEFFCGFSRHQAGWVAFGDSVTHGGKQIQICNGSQKHF